MGGLVGEGTEALADAVMGRLRAEGHAVAAARVAFRSAR
jgi:hypothetical protein